MSRRGLEIECWLLERLDPDRLRKASLSSARQPLIFCSEASLTFGQNRGPCSKQWLSRKVLFLPAAEHAHDAWRIEVLNMSFQNF